MTKYFGIGWNRTGTLSLANAFRILGFKAAHWGQIEHPIRAGFYMKDDYDSIVDFVRDSEFDMYSDAPWFYPLVYPKVDERFPGSKFILPIREASSWISSLKVLWGENDGATAKSPAFIKFFGCDMITGNEDYFTERCNQHNTDVIKYFEGREQDLLVLHLEKGDLCWEKLCPFLDREIPKDAFPHNHPSTEIIKRRKIKERIKRQKSKKN